MVGSWKRSRYQKYIAYWIEYQKRENGVTFEEEDDGKPSWRIEDGSSPHGEEFKVRKPLWRR